MFRKRMLALLAVIFCLSGVISTAAAAEVDCDSVYCFTAGDFSEEPITGICITGLPQSSAGTILLGSRVLRTGDILTADQVAQMTFSPLRTEEDAAAQIEYLPIYSDRVETSAVMTLSIRGKEDKAPIAEDFALETYKNLEAAGKLKVIDPEGEAMTFTVTRQPKRGTVTIAEDGSFTYTPKKNKVGVDSFVYTATDPSGKVSREATVTITILKPTDAMQYTDTLGKDCRFAAEWMKNTGIFVGENLVGNPCFNPEKEVTRGEFVTMLVKALEIDVDEQARYTGYTDEIPQWLQPYLAAAVRSGLTAGLPEQQTFGADTPITGAEAAVMLQNALDLAVCAPVEAVSTAQDTASDGWAGTALTTLAQNDIALSEAVLTRADAAQVLYQAVQLNSRDIGMFSE